MVNMRNPRKFPTSPRRVRTQITEQQVKNVRTAPVVALKLVLPEVSIAETIYIAEALFFCLTYYVTPAVRRFLCSKGLISPTVTNYDFADIIQTLSYYNNIDGNFLATPMTFTKIGNAVCARNEVCHFNLAALKKNWSRNLSTWMELCRSVGDERSASDVQTVFRRLRRGQYQHAIEEKAFFCTTGTHDEQSAFGLSLILYSCLARHVGPSLRNFLVEQKQITSTDLDVYQNLKHIIDKQRSDSKYLAKDASQRTDSVMLKVAMDGRNYTCHGKFSKVSMLWKMYLQSWVDLMNVINAKVAAEEIQEILDTIVVSEKNALQIQPTLPIFFPSIF